MNIKSTEVIHSIFSLRLNKNNNNNKISDAITNFSSHSQVQRQQDTYH